MIFVVEHEKDGIWQLQTVRDVEDLDTSKYQPINKIFLCENEDEVKVVCREIIDTRFK